MRRAPSAVLAVLLFASPCLAAPHHWYKSGKFWIGEAVIVGSLVADGRSSCVGFSRGLVEGNPLARGSRSCGEAVSVLALGGAVYTGLHVWAARLNYNEPSRAWRILGAVEVPVTVCAFHCTAAARNYEKLPAR